MKKALFLLLFPLSSFLVAFAQNSFEHLRHTSGCCFQPEADSGFYWSDRGGLHSPYQALIADTIIKKGRIQPSVLPLVYLPAHMTLHFLSPQPIQYVDISAKAIEGDLALKNVLRIRLKESESFSDAVVTIAGEDFIAQYHLMPGGAADPALVEIQPADTRPLDMGIGLSRPEMRKLAAGLLYKRPEANREHAEAYGIRASLNHVYTFGEYIFVDLSYDNRTRLHYDIDEFRFKIDDKKVVRATTVQSLEIKPEFVLFDQPGFSRHYRNVFVFKKFTIPGNKLLNIELNENQLSGRVVVLKIPYRDVLNADIIP
jgi:conjugative transposon TraN protein